MTDAILELLPARKGHFLLESGHHGDLWLDLDLLCLNPDPVRRFAAEIARRLARYEVDMICGPLVEGAFVALLTALELGAPYSYTERFAREPGDALYPYEYRIPRNLRDRVRGKRVAIVNDVINAGSAVRGTFAELRGCEARPVAIGAILVLGTWASEFAAANRMGLETLCALPNTLWTAADCPLCRNNVALSESG